MKYAHKFDPMKDVLPPFWKKDFYQVPLKRLDTSKMSPLEAAAYENALMRHKVVVDHHEQELKKAVAEAVEKAVSEAVEKAVETTAEGLKKETVKKGLLMGLGTIPQIAEMLGVSVDFVKQVQLSLENSDKPKPKKRSKKAKPK
jgi:hypothetical protein